MDEAATTPLQPSGLTNNHGGASQVNGLTDISNTPSTPAGEGDAEPNEEEKVDDLGDDDFDEDCDCFPLCQFCDAYRDGFDYLGGLHWCGCERCHEGALDDCCYLDLDDQILELEMAITDTESVYKSGCQPTRYTTGLNVDYDLCTVTQLKKFIQDRRLQSPSAFKIDYIRTLAKADSDNVFRFMDLPPEMRNEIYRYLLMLQELRPGQAFCNPAILRTCKEVNREGSSILWEENPILCSFAVTSHDTRDYLSREVRIHNIHRSHVKIHRIANGLPFENIPQDLDDFPDFLRRVSHLRIHLKFEAGTNESSHDFGLQKLNRYLTNLTSAVMDDHKLKSLEVSVKLQLDGHDEEIKRKTATVLFPLRRLRNLKHMSVDGNVSDVVRAKLAQEAQRVDAAFNTARCLHEFFREAQALENLADQVDMSCCYMGCMCEDCEHEITSPFSRLIGERRERLEHFVAEAFSSTKKEILLRARLFDFRRWLDQMNIGALRKKLEDLESARRRRMAAETSSVARHLSDAAWAWSDVDRMDIKETEKDFDWHWELDAEEANGVL